MNLHSNDMTHSVLCQESSSKCSRPSKEAVYKPIDISLKDTSDWARLPTRLPGSDAGSALRSWRIAATLDKARASWAMRVEKIVFTRRFGSEEELFAPSFWSGTCPISPFTVYARFLYVLFCTNLGARSHRELEQATWENGCRVWETEPAL